MASDKPYYTIEEMLEEIADYDQNQACLQILKYYRALFQKAQGSTNNHQNWPGGYFDHVQEILNIASNQYEWMNKRRPLPFTLGDAVLILFLHDIEKPWKYELRPDGQLHHKPEFAGKQDDHTFRLAKLREYNIVLTDAQMNALKYVEGEMADYSPRRRVMNELAGFCHSCDVLSARVWHAHPAEHDDPWKEARRIRDAVTAA
ncbi:MAG TPA: hypothetical protein VHC68_00105 [Candidatus Paceibacterota bacterium]|nr:hypothetical protein [Candidatus Paceibacterota bacterium]